MTRETETQKNAKKPAWQLALVFISFFAILFVIFFLIFAVIFVPFPVHNVSPLIETKSLLLDLISIPGAVKHTPKVTFAPDDVLPASSLAERLPVSVGQICMSTGMFAEDAANGFECVGCEDATENQRLVYHGKRNQIAKLAVVCDIDLGELKGDIEAYDLEYSGGTSINAACNVCEGKGKCCAIILKRS